jgi:hypothetical protein
MHKPFYLHTESLAVGAIVLGLADAFAVLAATPILAVDVLARVWDREKPFIYVPIYICQPKWWTSSYTAPISTYTCSRACRKTHPDPSKNEKQKKPQINPQKTHK